MVVLGLTGGIACGKSAVTARFAKWAVPVVDADQVAREVVAPGTDGLAELLGAFGEGLRSADGGLDRKALGALVFADPAKRKALEAMLHPRIVATSAALLGDFAEQGHGFALYDAALLVETGRHAQFEGLVVVTSRPEVQLRRLIDRDGITDGEARARIAAQLPLAKKIAVATRVIDNSRDLETLFRRVDRVYLDLALQHGPPSRARGATS